MFTKFDRMQISYVNMTQTERAGTGAGVQQGRKVDVPEKETFEQIFEKAKNGNEMAAVLLDDWQRNCKPKDAKDMQVVSMINMAAMRIFR